MIETLGNGQFGEVYRGILKVKSKKQNNITNYSIVSYCFRLINI